ncbi:hypothetical protein HMPREF0973_00939 [Prevotella veroralis F0319]|uniref:Uncharacterized protein n=1 Tax=Prevotella veroralis F0319 TaxID=649761 RepID=C9MMV5_9BACT|nr:hypothetical protein HMPREF0973_00939 [Prevotella veroralis F0319]
MKKRLLPIKGTPSSLTPVRHSLPLEGSGEALGEVERGYNIRRKGKNEMLYKRKRMP